jgi:hypothetical protein
MELLLLYLLVLKLEMGFEESLLLIEHFLGIKSDYRKNNAHAPS